MLALLAAISKAKPGAMAVAEVATLVEPAVSLAMVKPVVRPDCSIAVRQRKAQSVQQGVGEL